MQLKYTILKKKKEISNLQADRILNDLSINENCHIYKLQLYFEDFEIDCIINIINKEYNIEIFAPLYNDFRDSIILLNTLINLICEKNIEIDDEEPIILSQYQLTNVAIKHLIPKIEYDYYDILPF